MHAYVDSRYMCPQLCEEQLAHNIYCTGTVDSRRVGLPKLEIEAIKKRGLKWGEWTVLSKGQMELLLWQDKALVMILTTGFASTLLGHVVRRESKQQDWAQMTVPYAVQAYNQDYDGVDHTNQLLKHVSSFSHVRVLRHPRKQASFFKDINLTAAYIQYRLAGVLIS